MSYLWENYDIENEYKLAKKNFVPYTEIFKYEDKTARVNILFRFSEIYSGLSDYIVENVSVDELDKNMNVLFHMLANIDFYTGMSKKDIEMLQIYDDITEGVYGIDIELFKKLEYKHKYMILYYMYLRKKEKNKKCIFFDCLSEIFQSTFFYSKFMGIYIVQMPQKKEKIFGEENKYTALQLYELIKEMMCDYWLEVECYWKMPIAICDESIQIDKVQIV